MIAAKSAYPPSPFAPIAPDVEYPLARQLRGLVLDDDVVEDELVDVAVNAAAVVTRFDAEDVPRLSQAVVSLDEQDIAVPGVPWTGSPAVRRKAGCH